MADLRIAPGDGEPGYWVWLCNDAESFEHPADDPNSLIVGSGSTKAQAWEAAADTLRSLSAHASLASMTEHERTAH